MTLWRAALAWESVALFTLCTADMLSTLYWVHTHVATEANPWMAFWLQHGDFAFCGVKLMSYIPLLLFAAYHRPQRPKMIALSLRVALGLYVAMYLVAVGSQLLPSAK